MMDEQLIDILKTVVTYAPAVAVLMYQCYRQQSMIVELVNIMQSCMQETSKAEQLALLRGIEKDRTT